MKEAFISFAICFVLACWVFVIGHQICIDSFQRLGTAELGIIPIAYTVTALSFVLMIAATVATVFKR